MKWNTKRHHTESNCLGEGGGIFSGEVEAVSASVLKTLPQIGLSLSPVYPTMGHLNHTQVHLLGNYNCHLSLNAGIFTFHPFSIIKELKWSGDKVPKR